jgi:hypothetical protein
MPAAANGKDEASESESDGEGETKESALAPSSSSMLTGMSLYGHHLYKVIPRTALSCAPI